MHNQSVSGKPKNIKVLIVDDNRTMRDILEMIVSKASDMEVIGTAENGRAAVELALELNPDLITMDIEMPIMNGLEAIKEIMLKRAIPILVISSIDNAKTTFEAIKSGALDFYPKDHIQENDLLERIRLLSKVKVIKHIAMSRSLIKPNAAISHESPLKDEGIKYASKTIIAIASSTGGPQALSTLFSELPGTFPCPIVVAQHMSIGFVEGLVDVLQKSSNLTIKMGEVRESLQPGTVYVSPSSQHMQINAARRIEFLERQPGDIYFPSCDVLLSSVAESVGKSSIGVILTGMGKDGLEGMRRIKQKGGKTIAQDEQTSVVFGMPKEAIEAGLVDSVLPLKSLGSKISELVT
jgi:two-component system chemotaxis response regulator CheB